MLYRNNGAKKKILKRYEKDIQREICDWLHEIGVFFWRSNNIPVFGFSNDGKRRFRAMPKYTPKGLPDIVVIDQGRFVGIEVKRPKFKLRPDQEKFAVNVQLAGGKYFVAYSLDDVQREFSHLDLLERKAA